MAPLSPTVAQFSWPSGWLRPTVQAGPAWSSPAAAAVQSLRCLRRRLSTDLAWFLRDLLSRRLRERATLSNIRTRGDGNSTDFAALGWRSSVGRAADL